MMDIKNKNNTKHKPVENSQKQDKNAGSGAFNRGSEDEPDMNDGVADGTPNPEKVSKEKENPKSGKVG